MMHGKSRLYLWGFANPATAVLVSVAMWTVGRDYLVLTDGVPTAGDPLEKSVVLIVNIIAVIGVWTVLTTAYVLIRALTDRGRP